MFAFPFQRDSERDAAKFRASFCGLSFEGGFASTANVNPLPGTVRDTGEPFASTRWSVILAAADSQTPEEVAGAALSELCQHYWAPLYTFVRHRGYSSHDAQDLTQSFFAYLIENRIYARADRAKGKFRSFLLASLKHHLADARDREQTLKRGGGRQFLPLSEAQIEDAESFFQTEGAARVTTDEDRLFERSWAETLVNGALVRLASEYRGEGKANLFHELQTYLTSGAEPVPTYEELSGRLGVPASTLRSDVTRLRARYRRALRAEAARTVESEGNVDEELRELLRVLIRQ